MAGSVWQARALTAHRLCAVLCWLQWREGRKQRPSSWPASLQSSTRPPQAQVGGARPKHAWQGSLLHRTRCSAFGMRQEPPCVCVCVCWATVGRWCKVLLLFPCVNSRCGPRWPAMRHSSAYVNQGPQGTYFGTCGPARCVLVFFGRAGAGLHIAAPSLWRSLLLLPFSLCILSVIQLPWRSSVHSPPKM